MAGFGLPQPGDFYARTQQAMTGAQNAGGQMVDMHNINSRNALAAQEMAMRQQEMALNEAYRRDALDQEFFLNERHYEANQPGVLDNIGAGLSVAGAGVGLYNSIVGEGGTSLWERVASWY